MDGGGSRVFSRWIEEKSEGGCAFILDDGGRCGGGRKQNSSYCDHHHALCHIAEGSVRERRRLRETEALANAVGGRRGKPSHRGDHAPGLRAEVARTSVWRAVSAVGGISSPAGSCLWHVVGWERSLKEWAQEQGWAGRRVSQEAASGILIAALGALETHFR